MSAVRNVAFVKLPIANTVLYSVIMYTIIHAVIAVKMTVSDFVRGIFRFLLIVKCRIKTKNAAPPSDSGRVTFIVAACI